MSLIKTFTEKLVFTLERIPSSLLIFLVLASVYVNFTLTGNEETYLALSKQWFDPDWIPNSENILGQEGTQLFYQYIAGAILNFLSFEYTAFLGRFVLCIGFAYLLSTFYRLFSFTNTDILLHLAVLYVGQQSFFAHEWIFLDFEPKQLSYLFVFSALITYLNNKTKACLIFLILATYLHVLVGGWAALAILGTKLIFNRDKLSFKSWSPIIVYSLAIVPMAFILYGVVFRDSSNLSFPVHPDWINAYFRHQHHLGIFSSLNYFVVHHSRGVILTLIALVASIGVMKQLNKEAEQKLNQIAILSLIVLLVGVVLAFFDKTGVFLKFYPFRLGAIAAFMVFMLFVCLLKVNFLTTTNSLFYSTAVLVLFFFFHYPKLISNAGQYKNYFYPKEKAFIEMTDYIRNDTPVQSKFLYIDQTFDGHFSFNRLTQRDRFVSRKFVPVRGSRLYEWYLKIKEKEKLINDFAYLDTLMAQYPIDYLLINRSVNRANLSLKFNNEQYFLYQIEEQ